MNFGWGIAIESIRAIRSECERSRMKAVEAQARTDALNIGLYIENQKFIKRINDANN